MATPFPFTLGQTLTAAQMNAITTLPSTTKTASHTLVIADQGTRVIMNVATANTITVNTSIFGAGDIVEIQNIGAGVCTVTAGTATVSSAGPLAIPQNGGGRLIFSSASAATYFPTAVTQSSGGLTLVSATTIGTTVSSVTVSSAFSATYDNYVVTVTGGTGSAAAQYLTMQLGATTTGYYFAGYYSEYASPSLVAVRQSNGSSFRVGTSNTPTPLTGWFELLQPNVATETRYNARFSEPYATGTSSTVSGFLSNSTQYTAFTITPTSGTLTGGTIRVYGYANS